MARFGRGFPAQHLITKPVVTAGIVNASPIAGVASVSVVAYNAIGLDLQNAPASVATVSATAYPVLARISPTPTVASASTAAITQSSGSTALQYRTRQTYRDGFNYRGGPDYATGITITPISGSASVADVAYDSASRSIPTAGVASVANTAYAASVIQITATTGSAAGTWTAYQAAASTSSGSSGASVTPGPAQGSWSAYAASISASIVAVPQVASVAVTAYNVPPQITFIAGLASASVAGVTLPGSTTTIALGNSFTGRSFTGVGPLGGYGPETLNSGVDIIPVVGTAQVADAAYVSFATSAAAGSVVVSAQGPAPTVDVTFSDSIVGNAQGQGLLGWGLLGGYNNGLPGVLTNAYTPTLINNAVAGVASVAAIAQTAAPTDVVPVGSAAGSWAAFILPGTNVPLPTPASVGANAYNAAASITFTSAFAAASTAAYTPSAFSPTVQAIPASVGVVAYQPSASVSGIAAGTAGVIASIAGIQATPNPATTIGGLPSVATASVVANGASVNGFIPSVASVATVAETAYQTASSISVIPVTAVGTWAAFQVNSLPLSNAPASVATVAVSAYNVVPAASVSVTPVASVAATAYGIAQSSIALTAGTASVSAQSYNVAPTVMPLGVGVAAGIWAASVPAAATNVDTRVTAGFAPVTITANDQTGDIVVAPQSQAASVVTQAYGAITSTIAGGVVAASVIATAYSPQFQNSTDANPVAGFANTNASGLDATVGLAVDPLTAGDAEGADPPDATTSVNVTPITAAVTLTAFSPATIDLTPAGVIAAAFDVTVTAGPTFTPETPNVACTAYAPVVTVSPPIGTAAVSVQAHDVGHSFNPGADFRAGIAHTGWVVAGIGTYWIAGSSFTIWNAELLQETELA